MQTQHANTEIDFDHLRRYVGDDRGLTAEVFGLFKNQVDLWLKSLRPEASDEQWAAVTHSLKGTARAVGAMNLAGLCERAEQLVGAGNRPGGREVATQNIEHCVHRVLTDIQRWEYDDNMRRLREGG